MKVYNENVFASLLRLIAGGKVRREFRKIEKMTENDPQIKADLETMRRSYEEVEKNIAIFCKRNPDHELCQPGRGRVKTDVIPIYEK
jgi:hypothetical protein